ncbi:hypothetical protein CEUSTIGMA_g10482.t1 [Chlamydomonas eustigma]|uniref:RING-type domain-containing protein n=1 Tax=Chlamydomonas eustigma TaxID=1157962 RepID=A0A250XJ59_9CHLO|nr:hypothetical protein CEUSTIGMA_g10482.t1 [Chlamydomonas eustigma]|eukprot:GAX83056.1 hypothetical protein CEUSTIGMA_g10482.t1 [Chlamydomonas eustigma]
MVMHATQRQFEIDEIPKHDVIRAVLVNKSDCKGLSPLICAAANGQAEACKFLLSNGADPLHVDHAGLTALHHACQLGCNLSVNVLLEHSAENDCTSFVNVQQPCTGMTPLHFAASSSCSAIAKLLLMHGADLQLVTTAQFQSVTAGSTPLHFAAVRLDKDMVEIMVASCSNHWMFVDSPRLPLDVRCIKDSKGLTPLHYARSRRDIALLLHPALLYIDGSGSLPHTSYAVEVTKIPTLAETSSRALKQYLKNSLSLLRHSCAKELTAPALAASILQKEALLPAPSGNTSLISHDPQEDDDCCPVCMEQLRDVTLMPCGHAMCFGCIRDIIMAHSMFAPVDCALCRTHIQGFRKG